MHLQRLRGRSSFKPARTPVPDHAIQERGLGLSTSTVAMGNGRIGGLVYIEKEAEYGTGRFEGLNLYRI